MSGDDSNGKKPAGNGETDTEAEEGDALGQALRTVYDEAANEEIPADLLELLGKLK